MYQIPIDIDVYNQYTSDNYIYDTHLLRYNVVTYVHPNKLYLYNVNDNTLELVKEKIVPNYNPEDYQIKRFKIPSNYGVSVPITMLYHKDVNLNEVNPL